MVLRLVLCTSLLACSSPASKTLSGTTRAQDPSALAGTANNEQLQRLIFEGQAVRALRLAAEMEVRGETISHETVGKLGRLVDRIDVRKLPELPPSAAASLVSLRRALVALHAGDRQLAETMLARAGTDSRWLTERNTVAGRLAELERTLLPNTIAVLLPLSGDHAELGQALLDGITLAAATKVKLEVIDTKGNEEGARLAVRQAADLGCVLAIGPVGQLESTAAASEAAKQGLPMALLSPIASDRSMGPGVFRFALSPRFEAEQAAIVASELGHSLVAVLAPRDELGQMQARAFARSARSLGSEVVAVGDYDPAALELEQDLRKFLNLDPRKNRRLRQHFRLYGRKSRKSFSPDIDFDLLYIPDHSERAALVASYLPFFNVELQTRDDLGIAGLRQKHGGRIPRIVQLMGSGAWLSPTLAARGGAAVEGALIVSTCPGGLAIDRSEQAQAFYREFHKTIGHKASAASAMAFDAATMVLVAHKQATSRGGTSEDMRIALQAATLRDGVCGSFQMDQFGQVFGQIEVLRVESGNPEIYEY